MGRQVPCHIDVLLVESQIKSACRDILDFSEVPGIHDFLDFLHNGRIKESMPDHQDQSLLLGNLNQFFAFARRCGHRFLNERMFARQQTRLGHRVMQSNGRRDHDCIQSSPVEQVVEIPLAFYIRIQRSEMFKPLLAEVAHHFEAALGKRLEIANEIGSPISTADDTDYDLFSRYCLPFFPRGYPPLTFQRFDGDSTACRALKRRVIEPCINFWLRFTSRAWTASAGSVVTMIFKSIKNDLCLA